MSLDAEAFVDEGNVEAGLPENVEVDEAPPVTEEAPAPEVHQEEEQPATEEAPAKEEASDDRSFIMSKLGKPTEQEAEETKVPLHVVTDLRQKNRDLKQQLEEQAQARPAGEHAEVGADPLKDLEDDDYLTAGQARAARAHDQSVAERRRQESEQQAAQTTRRQETEKFLLESEAKAKADHPDYSAVMTAADEYMSPAEFQAALQTKNPAKTLYAKAKQTIASLGIELQTPVATKPKEKQSQEEETLQTDDEVFHEVFPAT